MAESGSGLTAKDKKVLVERYGFDPNEDISEPKVDFFPFLFYWVIEYLINCFKGAFFNWVIVD